jgi:hypothetical protein
VICAALLIALLAGWTATGGAGTITRARLQVTLAAVPMRAFSPRAAAKAGQAHVYLDIRNLGATADELLAVRSPAASRIVLTERAGPGAKPAAVTSLTIPGDGTLALSPLGNGVVLENPVPFESDGDVPLTLVFRHAGQITIDAPVTPPGTP